MTFQIFEGGMKLEDVHEDSFVVESWLELRSLISNVGGCLGRLQSDCFCIHNEAR